MLAFGEARPWPGGGAAGRRREPTTPLHASRPDEATPGEQASLDAAQETASRAPSAQAGGEQGVPRPKSAGKCFCSLCMPCVPLACSKGPRVYFASTSLGWGIHL